MKMLAGSLSACAQYNPKYAFVGVGGKIYHQKYANPAPTYYTARFGEDRLRVKGDIGG